MVFSIAQKLAHQKQRRQRKVPDAGFRDTDDNGNACQPKLLCQYYYTQWCPETHRLKKHVVTAPSSKIGKLRFQTLQLASRTANRIQEVSRYVTVPNQSWVPPAADAEVSTETPLKPAAKPKPQRPDGFSKLFLSMHASSTHKPEASTDEHGFMTIGIRSKHR